MKTGPQQRTSGVTGHFNAVLANPIPCFTIPSELTSCPLYMLSPRKSSGGLSASTSSMVSSKATVNAASSSSYSSPSYSGSTSQKFVSSNPASSSSSSSSGSSSSSSSGSSSVAQSFIALLRSLGAKI